MKDLKEKLNKLSVLVFGDMYLDRDCIGDFVGKSKEDEKLPILKIHTEKYQPGGAGNLAFCFASLGVKTTVVGLWGDKDDINRQILEQSFKDKEINTSCMVKSGKTPVFGKFYTSNGDHIFRYDIISENMTDNVEEVLDTILALNVGKADFIACADYNNSGIRDLVCENTLKSILESEKQKFATGRKELDKFKGFNCLLLNEKEFIKQFEILFGLPILIRNIPDIIKKLDINSFVLTSKNGAIGFDVRNNKFESNSVKIKEKFDTCGCGDMFYAMYASSIMAHYGMQDSLDLANIAAGIVAKKMFGAAQASIDEVIDNL